VPTVGRRYGIYFTGIGGTGVVTANRIIAAAADAAGFVIGGLDQTGLSQKAGAVVSHLHLAASRDDLGAASVDAHSADLYLSGDILQAAGARHLEKIRPGRTIAVIDRDMTPTSAMLQSDLAVPDVARLEQAVAARAGADRAVFLDAKRMAETAFGDHLFANVILLGAAFQLGGLPVTLDDIGRAMGQQGKAAAANREAFEWGRWAVHDQAATDKALSEHGATGHETASVFDPSPAALTTASAVLAGRPVPAELRDLLTRRTAQAVDYQDARLAGRFLDLVRRAAAHDDAEHGWALTRAVAESYFKLLTYKDEYEVARLHLAADYGEVARDLGITGPYKVTYQLHPPVLRRLGMQKKLPLSTFYALGFRALRPMKRLRGTPLDFFGWDRDRRTERAIIGEYERLIERTIAAGMPYELLVQLAESALSIKGYASVKEAAVDAWRARVAELSTRPSAPTT
jgi:indolepyruvate ferredoxin oxidoreductase